MILNIGGKDILLRFGIGFYVRWISLFGWNGGDETGYGAKDYV